MIEAAEIMTVGVLTATLKMTVGEAATLMSNQGVCAYPVPDENESLIGMISEADPVRRTGRRPRKRGSSWLRRFTFAQTFREHFLKPRPR